MVLFSKSTVCELQLLLRSHCPADTRNIRHKLLLEIVAQYLLTDRLLYLIETPEAYLINLFLFEQETAFAFTPVGCHQFCFVGISVDV